MSDEISFLGQKIKDTLAFNQNNVVAQNVFNIKLFKTFRTTFTLSTSIIGHKHTQSKQTSIIRTKHKSKEKL
jgi:hypothetical protein